MSLKLKTSLLAAACALTACVSPAKSYIAKHPELSAEHRRILLTGKVSDGAGVAGMTKEQVRLAMGADPDQFTTIDGVYAWVYLHNAGGSSSEGHHHRRHDSESKSEGGESSDSGGSFRGSHGGGGNLFGNQGSSSTPSEKKAGSRTTIFFTGDLATRAQVSREY